MKKIKIFLAGLLAVIMICSFVGCKQEEPEEPSAGKLENVIETEKVEAPTTNIDTQHNVDKKSKEEVDRFITKTGIESIDIFSEKAKIDSEESGIFTLTFDTPQDFNVICETVKKELAKSADDGKVVSYFDQDIVDSKYKGYDGVVEIFFYTKGNEKVIVNIGDFESKDHTVFSFAVSTISKDSELVTK